MERNIIVNNDVLKHLNLIVEYMIESEQTHYEESEPKDRVKHIYKSVLKIKKWLEENQK